MCVCVSLFYVIDTGSTGSRRLPTACLSTLVTPPKWSSWSTSLSLPERWARARECLHRLLPPSPIWGPSQPQWYQSDGATRGRRHLPSCHRLCYVLDLRRAVGVPFLMKSVSPKSAGSPAHEMLTMDSPPTSGLLRAMTVTGFVSTPLRKRRKR